MENIKNKKAIIYYRVSTEDQAQFGVSLEQQKNNCLSFAEREGWEVVKSFHDDGVSAKTVERPSLQAMLQYCSKNYKQIDYVVIYKVDRLSRNVNDYSNILFLLNKLNIKLVSTTEAIDDTPIGKFVGNIMAANAQMDNEIKGQRVSACMLEKVKQGVWCWKAPFGYKNSRDEFNRKVITIDEKRAELIRFIFE
ncbi:MAG: recombinase family protein, partial [Patescibacteria group bacterium]